LILYSGEKFRVYFALLKARKRSTCFRGKAHALAKKNPNLPNLSPHAFRTRDATFLRAKKVYNNGFWVLHKYKLDRVDEARLILGRTSLQLFKL
jgi:hypothetical protein